MSRQEFTTSFKTEQHGKQSLTIIDRINPDDVCLFMIQEEIYRLLVGKDYDDVIDPYIRDFLLLTQYQVR